MKKTSDNPTEKELQKENKELRKVLKVITWNNYWLKPPSCDVDFVIDTVNLCDKALEKK